MGRRHAGTAEMRTQGFFVSVRCRRNNRRGDDELLKYNWVELVISGRTDSDSDGGIAGWKWDNNITAKTHDRPIGPLTRGTLVQKRRVTMS